jgi:hypothetical protein
MVRAPPPIASNSAARRLASSKSATAMASAAVTAALAAAALVPREERLEELFDRKARLVAEHDGHDLHGHCSCFTVVRRSFD